MWPAPPAQPAAHGPGDRGAGRKLPPWEGTDSGPGDSPVSLSLRQTSAPAVLDPDGLAEMATPHRERTSALLAWSNLSRITRVQGWRRGTRALGGTRTHRPTAAERPARHPPTAVLSPGPAHSRAPRGPAERAASRAPAAACSRVLAGAEARLPGPCALRPAEGARGAGARGSDAGGDGDSASPAPRRGQRDRRPGHEAGDVHPHPHPLGARGPRCGAGEPSGDPDPVRTAAVKIGARGEGGPGARLPRC